MLEENVVSTKPRFHFIADKQNDISSIVVELDYPVDISEVSRVMENLLLESADKLLRYKGMLWIDGEPNRLLFQASSASTAPTGTGHGAMKHRIARWCLSGFSCRRMRFGRRLRDSKVTSPPTSQYLRLYHPHIPPEYEGFRA